MSPRVKPRRATTPEYQRQLDAQDDLRDAAYEYRERHEELLHDVARKFGLPHSARSDCVYRPDPEGPSWFLDTLWSSGHKALRDFFPPPTVQGAGEARQRLGSVETRDLTTGSTDGGGFVPTGSPPSYVASAFATAARNAAVLASQLRVEPLPATGMTVSAPRLSSGATTAIQAAGLDPISETDPVTATASSPVATISGMVDVSTQLFDRSDPPIDLVLAEELGRAWGEDFDQQVLNGSGTGGQLPGLLVLAGTTATTATATTAAANIAQIGHQYMDVTVAGGEPPNVLIMHPRRAAFIKTMLGYSPVPWPTPTPPTEAPNMPTMLSPGTADAIIQFPGEQVILFPGRPSFRVMPEIGSGSLVVRCVADA